MNIDSRRSIKEMIVSQKAVSIWLTGLSGSGKSTLAYELDSSLSTQGYLTAVLDGNKVRKGLNSNLGFSMLDRMENIRRAAEVSKILVENGVIAINAFIAPTEKIRQMAKSIVGEDDFILIYLSSPLEICEKRDVKGYYAKARGNSLPDFTGISSAYEIPKNANLILDTAKHNIDECVEKLVSFIIPKISGKISYS